MTRNVSESERVLIDWNLRRDKDGELKTPFVHYKDSLVGYATKTDISKIVFELIDDMDRKSGII